ncbi:LapA family protein [Tomitella biformata]|uniref:LapA family protein n=1 Tax=Tomitella biformata TaxID=630403 RepID=UPI000463486B|nr:lipopolysaccharide assembly protein LapA domain-containing protein [Tomitella biformata]
MTPENQPNPDLPSEATGLPQPPLPADPSAGEAPTLPPTGATSAATTRKRDWDRVRATRTGRAWTGLIVGAIILVLLLVFIIQNLDSVRLNVLAWEWNLPIGVAILFAAIIGALLAGLIGGARILQLRRAAKKLPR